MDYLILGFDGKGALTALVWPEVRSAGTTKRFGVPGYRDALCELIARKVVAAASPDDESVLIELEGDSHIYLQFGEEAMAGERAILTGVNRMLYVWSGPSPVRGPQ